MSATGIIFSNIHDKSIPNLTAQRTMASVPFGCRYRLIDFALSNMVNAGVTDVDVITHYNYNSLMDHVGSGKDWDLARRTGGLKILPPFVTAYGGAAATKLYETRLDALLSVFEVIKGIKTDLIVLSDCDSICNLDLKEMMDQHVKSGAKITFATKKMAVKATGDVTTVKTSECGRIVAFEEAVTASDEEKEVLINIWVANKDYMVALLLDAMAHGYHSFTMELLSKYLDSDLIATYNYDGFYASISSMEDYFACNMSLLDPENSAQLFRNRQRPVLTKVRNSAPTTYVEGCEVNNSMIADGCIIEGTVENSILFRGVKVGKGSVVKNCILFQDTMTGDGVTLNCVIADKNVTVRDNVVLSGHSTMPLYIEKGKMI